MKDFKLDLHGLPPLRETVEDCHRVIKPLWQVLKELQERLEALEEQVRLGSDNSSQAPSQDGPKQWAERKRKQATGRKKGGQVGHSKHERSLVPESQVNEIRHDFPHGRCGCSGTVEVSGYRPHQVFDLPEVRYEVVEHQVYAGRCCRCGRRHLGAIPIGVPSSQMGPGLVAWIGLLTGCYHLPLREVVALLEAQWGLKFSLGAISESQAPLQQWMGPVYRQIGEAVRRALVVHADETRHNRNRSVYGLWARTTAEAAYFMTHSSRGKGAAGALLGDFQGILVTDRHGAYNDHPEALHQYCWAHLIRNLERIAQRKSRAGRNDTRWLRLARLPIHGGKRWQQSHYPSDRYRGHLIQLKATFHQELERAVRRHCGRSGRKQLSDFPRLWTFLDHPDVPMTHNTAKRLEIGVYQTLRTLCAQGMATGEVTFRLPILEPKPMLVNGYVMDSVSSEGAGDAIPTS